VIAGTTLNYNLPSWSDKDEDDVEVKATIAPTSPLPPFIRFSYPKFIFTPSTLDIGSYNIKVRLSDHGSPLGRASYEFKLTVLEPLDDEEQEALKIGSIKASLEKVSMKGVITINFSKAVTISNPLRLATELECLFIDSEGSPKEIGVDSIKSIEKSTKTSSS